MLITTELSRALAVVKVTSQVNGKPQFSRSRRPKTIRAVNLKLGTVDRVGEGTHCPKPTFGDNRITGGFSPYW